MRKRIFTVMAALCSVAVMNAADVTVNAGDNLATKIGEAGGSGTVRVEVGTYVLPAELIIPAGVKVIGGYPAGDFTDANRIYPGATTDKAQMTIFDGDASHRVASVAGTLEGVVIRNGHVRNGNGGGVLVEDGGTVQNCIIKGNVAMNVGGATDALGGGAYLNGADAKLINCVVAFNMANNGYGVAGEGQVINNTITANTYAPVAIDIAGNVSGTPFQHFAHSRETGRWSYVGDDAQELYFNDFKLAQTQTTTSQFAVFAAAMDLKVDGTSVVFEDGAKGTEKLFEPNATYGLHVSGSDFIYNLKDNYANKPMSNVTWYGAAAYCQWIGGALPTEGQWEYAARMNADGSINNLGYAGVDSYDELRNYAVYSGNPGSLQEVATKLANGIGLYDMTGNVWEWCLDLYDATGNAYPDYTLAAVSSTPSLTDPVNDKKGSYRVTRGGSYGAADGYLALAFRYINTPTTVSHNLGFRPVLVP